jgi:hypothetical protein
MFEKLNMFENKFSDNANNPTLSLFLSSQTTTRNTARGCALSKAVLHEPRLKHYQQWFISSCPFQLLVAGLSVTVLHVEPLVIIL